MIWLTWGVLSTWGPLVTITNLLCQEVKQLWLVIILPQEVLPVWWKCILLCDVSSHPLTLFGPCICFQTGWSVDIKNNVCCLVYICILVNSLQKIKSCIVRKRYGPDRWQRMDQSWPINDKSICLWLLVWRGDVLLQYRCQKGPLTAIHFATITQGCRKGLIFILEELLQVTLPVLTGDEELGK